MKNSELKKQLGYNPMFASRENMDEAFNYLEQVAKGTGASGHVITAAMVVLNTHIEQVVEHYELAPKQ